VNSELRHHKQTPTIQVTKLVHAKENPWDSQQERRPWTPFYSTAEPHHRVSQVRIVNTVLDKQQDPLLIRTGTTTQADTNASNLENTQCKTS